MDWAVPENGLETGAPSPLNSYLMLCLDLIRNDQLRPDGLAYEDEDCHLLTYLGGFGRWGLKFINHCVLVTRSAELPKSSIRKINQAPWGNDIS